MKITRIGVSDGNDSIVVIRDLSDLSGGRTLDMSGWTGKDVRAGHIIIRKANGDYAPLGVESMAYVDLSTGEEYAGVLKKSVTKKDPRAAIMTSGIVNYKALPYEIDGAIAAGLNDILFAGYVPGEEPGPTPPTPTADYLCFTANKAGATLRMTGMYSEDYTGDDFALEYSTDGETWIDWNFTKVTSPGMIFCVSDTLTFTSIGDKVYLRGDNAHGTSLLAILFGDTGYIFTFEGGEGTQPNDNVFAVTGDLQTLKDKTGQDKVAAEFAQLFLGLSGEEPTILITSAPDLTASTLIDNCYMGMFLGQILLTSPAAMPLFTFADLPANRAMEISGCFGMMYAGSGISAPANFNNVEISGTLSQDEVRKVFNFYHMYYGVSEINSNFAITNDNGDSLIGFDGIEFPIVFVDSPYDCYTFANDILGIEEGAGFDMVYLYSEPNDNTYGSTHFNHIGSDNGSLWLPTNGSVEIGVGAYPNTGYQFVKWQSSSDGETWTDIPGATSSTYTATLTQAGDYYYKAIFEQTNP